MKGFIGTVLKILAALAAIAGAVYAAATYGDKVVAWAKNLWSKFFCDDFCCYCDDDDCCCDGEDCCCCEEEQAEEADFEG